MKFKLIYILAFASVISLPLSAQNVGIGTTTPQNTLDVSGGLSVGAGYSGTYTAPANGAIFQGGVGIGVTSLNATYSPKLEVNGEVMGTVFRDRNDGNFGLAPSSTFTSLYAAGDLFGAAFYDYNNTFYFLNPSGTDISLNVAGKIHATSILDEDNTNYYLDPSSTNTSLRVAGDLFTDRALYAAEHIEGSAFYDYHNPAYFLDPGNTNLAMNLAGRIDAKSFYDEDNTTYYVDPSSVFSSINVAGSIATTALFDQNNQSYYLNPSSTSTSLNVAGKVVAVGDLETSDDLNVADDAFIIDNLDVSGSAFIGSTSSDEKITLTHGPSGGFQIQNSGNSSFWDIWNKPDNDLGLYLNASLRGQFNSSSGIYTSASDRRLKDNIRSLGSVLPSLLQLQAKKYSFKADPNRADNIGFIAQEVEKLFPELVTTPIESGAHQEYYMMDYAGFGVLAVQAIQEQHVIIESQNERLGEQGREIHELKSELTAIKAMLAQVAKNQ